MVLNFSGQRKAFCKSKSRSRSRLTFIFNITCYIYCFGALFGGRGTLVYIEVHLSSCSQENVTPWACFSLEKTPLLPRVRTHPLQFTGPMTLTTVHWVYSPCPKGAYSSTRQRDNWKEEMVEDKISGPRKQGLSKREAKEESFELVILEVQGRKFSIFSLSGAP